MPLMHSLHLASALLIAIPSRGHRRGKDRSGAASAGRDCRKYFLFGKKRSTYSGDLRI